MSFLGTIITAERTPSTSEFLFVLSPEANVKKGQYVQTSNPQGIVFGVVNELVRTNKYFERAESVAEYERITEMSKNFPVDAWNYTVGEVKILGTFDNDKFMRAYVPPLPGTRVFDADKRMLEKFLGFTDDGLNIGMLQNHDLEVRLDLTRLLQKHLAILAMSGAGKSHLASVLIEELLDRPPEKGRIAIVVIDIHGEYCGFASDPHYANQVIMIDGKDIRMPLRKLSPELIEEWIPHATQAGKELLRKVLYELKANTKSPYSLKEVLAAIEESKHARDEVKRPLSRALEELGRLRFLSRAKENPRLSKVVRPGRMLILDFSSIDSLRKKQILTALIARKLFRLRKKDIIPPFLLLIEEAHNFAREKAEANEALSRAIIETIAREGRKFGASLCLISQRPVHLSTTALSQCGTHIILRITNPNDLEHIQTSSEGIDGNVARSITGLQTGEAIIVGGAVNAPVFVSVRQRKSIKKERGVPLHQQAIEFERKEKEMKEKIEAFL